MTPDAPPTPAFESLLELAARIEDGMTVAVGGTLFTRMPVQLLFAVCAAGRRHLHYACWGGGLPLEMLLEASAVTKATLCFSSLDVFGQAKRFQAAVHDGNLELIEWTAHAFAQALFAGKRRLPSEPFTWPVGSDLTGLPEFPAVVVDPVSGTDVGAAPALRPDVLLLHAPAADEHGNIVLVGARAMELVMIPASQRVIVTVDTVVSRDELRRMPAGIVISRHFISAIAVVPGGAAPTSSLPFYLADFDGLRAWTAEANPLSYVRGLDTSRDGAVTPMAPIDAAAVAAALPADTGEPAEATPDEWMTCWLARQYPDGSICSVGAVSPLASASYLLAKATSAPSMTLITNGGCYIDVELRPVLFGLGEWLDACSALTIMGGEESYEWFYQAGLVSFEVVSVAQIDAFGRTNNRQVVTPSGRRLRLPGQGGMADVANMHQHFVVYLARQSKLNTPERVDFSTAARGLLGAADRRAAGYRPGNVVLVTNLAVFKLDEASGRFRVDEVFPWTTFDELSDSTGFDLGITSLDGLPIVAAPSNVELETLRRRVDPLGIRKLEFVPSRERGPLLETTIRAEAELATRILGRPFYRTAATPAGSA
jgi:acyl CoA:acetate/3-ketoacid CoA transferase alpha subunit/acyl CoA:acetate/3-ketoacid CoA transferase beta subunit